MKLLHFQSTHQLLQLQCIRLLQVTILLVWNLIFSNSKSEDKEEKSIRTKRHILLMFERPFEPLVLPKGPRNTRFDIPDNYWVRNHVPQTDFSLYFIFLYYALIIIQNTHKIAMQYKYRYFYLYLEHSLYFHNFQKQLSFRT